MTTTMDIITLILGTFLSVLGGIHFSNVFKQNLPEHLAVRLEQFARIAVQKVEQQAKDMSNERKKQLAILTVATLFKTFKLPAVAPEAVDIAIEAAVLLAPKPIVVKSTSSPVVVNSPAIVPPTS